MRKIHSLIQVLEKEQLFIAIRAPFRLFLWHYD